MRPIQVIAVVLISVGTVVAAKWGLERLVANKLASGQADEFRFANYWYGVGRVDGGPVDLVNTARMAIPATVRVSADMTTGAGAVLSSDGYIVTNNHVIAGANEVFVTLTNRKTLKAKVVGADPVSDLAVLKIDAANLPFLLYGKSEEIKVGQWVLAVGYPLGLQVTATAGIISGKGGSMDARGMERYLQTDAAVNLGNSGGPLVNPAGEIVGINTAIASPTGVYAGYSFAVPVGTVRRVVTELIRNGRVNK
jgi:serine protease Do